MELPDPPEGWTLKSLIEFNDKPASWSCQLWSPGCYVYGYGSSAKYAFLDAIDRVERGDFFEALSGYQNKVNPKMEEAARDLIATLLLSVPPPAPFKRRF